MIDNQFDSGFAVDWMRKDLGFCLDEARRNGTALPVTALVDEFYARCRVARREAVRDVEFDLAFTEIGRAVSQLSNDGCGQMIGATKLRSSFSYLTSSLRKQPAMCDLDHPPSCLLLRIALELMASWPRPLT